MLDRSHRFHGFSALNLAYKQGQTVRGPVLGLKYWVNPRRQTFRVAVVVSRKVSKSAVTRNRIRRRVYEVVRLQSGQITQPYDFIFSAFSDELATMDAAKLQQLVIAQLAKASVIGKVA
jgi:ribonuclease P protein component